MAYPFTPRKQPDVTALTYVIPDVTGTSAGNDLRFPLWKQGVKRGIDMGVSLLLLVLLSPLLIVTGLLVRLTSPGPVLFRQKRLGRNGKVFAICKFRTMRVDAPDIRNADGSAFSSDNDSRVTPVGKWLRKTSLDELPQFLNVLGGSMSLVGPRPDQTDQLAYYTEAETLRLAVKPGITGLAQISGRNTLSWEARKQLDITYVQQWSLRSDFVILARTLPYVLLQRGINNGPQPPAPSPKKAWEKGRL